MAVVAMGRSISSMWSDDERAELAREGDCCQFFVLLACLLGVKMPFFRKSQSQSIRHFNWWCVCCVRWRQFNTMVGKKKGWWCCFITLISFIHSPINQVPSVSCRIVSRCCYEYQYCASNKCVRSKFYRDRGENCLRWNTNNLLWGMAIISKTNTQYFPITLIGNYLIHTSNSFFFFLIVNGENCFYITCRCRGEPLLHLSWNFYFCWFCSFCFFVL